MAELQWEVDKFIILYKQFYSIKVYFRSNYYILSALLTYLTWVSSNTIMRIISVTLALIILGYGTRFDAFQMVQVYNLLFGYNGIQLET